jgi:hypothetical protein
MSKDLKIGMIIGVVLLIAATLVISFLSKGSLKDRLKNKYNKETSATTPQGNGKEQPPTPKKNTDNETPRSTERIHIVKEGQTIQDIAKIYYGNKDKIIKIIDENRQIPNNYKLKAGMKLKIPK